MRTIWVGSRVVGRIAAPGENGLALHIAEQAGISYDEAVRVIMSSFGGIPLVRPAEPGKVADLLAFLSPDREPPSPEQNM